MEIVDIEIGSKWEDTLGKTVWDKGGVKVIKRNVYREVMVTNKTSNSIEYKDEKRYVSWITFEDFVRVERANGRERFIKVL